MAPEREREFDELRAFITYDATHRRGLTLSSPVHPSNVIDGLLLKHGKSRVLTGLRMAINDTIEEMGDKPQDELLQFDDTLRAAGIVTFTELRRRYATSYKRMLKRELIKNETEYYLAKGIVDNLTSLVPQQERDQLETMMAAFEQTLLARAA